MNGSAWNNKIRLRFCFVGCETKVMIERDSWVYRYCTAVKSSCCEMFDLFLKRAQLLLKNNKILFFIIFKIINDKFYEIRIKTSHCDPHSLGYTRATIKITINYFLIKIN